MRASYLMSVIPEWLQNTKKSRRSYCDPSVQRKKSWPNGNGCVSALYRQKEKDFKFFLEVLFCDCPQVLLPVHTPVYRKERNVCKGNLSRVSLAC